MSGTEGSVSLDQHLFQLTCLVSAKDIQLSARSEVGSRQLLALVMGSGDIVFYYLSGETDQLPVMRQVPWFVDSSKRITALCFDPSGSWLLITGDDGSIFIVPALALVDPNAVLDRRWSTTDVTSFPSPLSHHNPSSNSCSTNIQCSHATSVVWWQSLLECHHVAIMGTDSGDLIFVSLTTGLQVGITFVRASVSVLHICQDNNLDSVFLLITSDNRSQWKLLLEQRATGYAWPIDSSGSAVKVVTSNNEPNSSSNANGDLEYGNKSCSYLPTTRSRLQGLKQFSVEKLTSLRQRLAETRSKGASAMAVNIHFRRVFWFLWPLESSGSSNDDTTCSVSVSGKSDSEGLDLPPIHHVTTGPQPEKLSSEVGDTFLCPQYARGRHLLSGYYAPNDILSIHGMSLDVVPLYVYKLAQQCRDVLVTDRFLYVTDIDGKNLSVVSCQLSECRIGGDSAFNPDSVIETFEMKGTSEKILSLYKQSYFNEDIKKLAGVSSKQSSVAGNKDSSPQVSFNVKSRGSSREKEKNPSLQAPFCLPKCVKELKLDIPSIDTCVIVTTTGVYELTLRVSPVEIFMDLVLKHQAIEKAERLALVFGLNLQQLLESAGDLKLSAKEFPQAIALYKLSRCRHLKSVLKFAAAGHAAELLSYITLLFSTSGLDLTTSERIHLSNLAVMSHTEQVLRATTGRVMLLKQFLKFLRENLYYDEVLAVNVAGQTGLWEVLQFLACFRGLHPEVLDILTKIVRSLGEGLVKALENKITTFKHLPALDSSLWLCVSDPSLLQSLLSKPQQARIHLQFVRTCLPHLEQFALQRLAALYDPSSPQLRPTLRRMFKIGRRREHSSGSFGSYSAQMDSLDFLDSVDEIFVPGEDIVQMFLLVLLYLAKKSQVSSFVFVPELMEKIQLAEDDEDSDHLCPSLPVRANTLSAGFSHVALIRNGAIYTWGNTAQGCLGTGPTMSRHSCPQQISLFPDLKLEVISVSCGRQHTLSLTNNGIYAWGSSQFGQLGIGKTGQCPYPQLVEHLSREHIIAVSAGQYHSIALADDGRVFTWGWGVHGQLGHCSVEDCHMPTLVERLIGKVVTQVHGGHGHTLALTAEGHVYTFGSSVFGQLGNGSTVKSSVPVRVTALTERITIIATNYFHNLAVSSTNKLYMWGASPQVLRLQAQAQKKAKLQQQHLPSGTTTSIVTPSSPSRPATAHVHSTSGINSEIPGLLLESPDLPTAAKPEYIDKDRRHNLKPASSSCDSELPSVDVSCSLSSNVVKTQEISAESNVNTKDSLSSHSELSSPILNNTDSLNNTSSMSDFAMKSSQCHNLLSENVRTLEVSNNEHVNIQKQSSQSNRDFPVEDGERIGEVQATHSEKNVQQSRSSFLCVNEKQEEFRSSNESDKTSSMQPSTFLSQDSPGSDARPVLSLASSDIEHHGSPNVDASPKNLQFRCSSFTSTRKDQNLDLKVSSDTKSNARSTKSELIDDGQLHLTPQPVDTSLVVGRIVQVSCGCHHSALLTRDGDLYVWGRNLDGQLGNGTRKEIPIPTPLTFPAASATPSTKNSSPSQSSAMPKSSSPSGVVSGGEKLRLQHISCGCEFTVAQEIASAGKVWAWGNNSLAQLGRVPVEDSKSLEGKLVMLKTTKRVIKLPHGSQKSCDVPKAVPGLPNCTISFKYDNLSGIGGYCVYLTQSSTELCPPLCSIEDPCYGLRTLHYTLQHFHGHYDSTYLLNKCLALENYQGAAKLAALDRHYHLALSYQLKALTLATLEFGFDPEKHHENPCTNFSRETDEKHLNSKKTESSSETANRGLSPDHSEEDKIRNTNFPQNSNMVNEAENRNPTSLIVKRLKARVTNVNSSCIHVENGSGNSKTEVTESIVTDSNLVNKVVVSTEAYVNMNSSVEDTAQCDDKEDTTLNEIKRDCSVSDTTNHEDNIINIEDKSNLITPQNRNYKTEIVTESDTENKNWRNSKLDLLYESEDISETNQVTEDTDTIKKKSIVGFSGEICVQLNEDLKSDSKLPLIRSSTDKTKPETEIEESVKLDDSNEEVDFMVNPSDDLRSKTQVFPIEEEGETSSSISTPESLISTNVNDSEMHAFAVQGGTEQMSEGHHLTSPDSGTSLVSKERCPMSSKFFISEVYEQSSHDADVNLICTDENRDFENPVAACTDVDKEKNFEQQNEDPDKCETELIGDLPPLLNSDKSMGDSESFSVIQQKNVLMESELNSRFLNDVGEPQSSFDTSTLSVESNISGVKEEVGVKTEDEMKHKTDNGTHEFQNNGIRDQKSTSECKSSKNLNETIGKIDNLKQELTSSDPNTIFFNSETCSKVVESDCTKYEHTADLSLKSLNFKEETGDSVTEEKLTARIKQPSVNLSTCLDSSSLSSTKNQVVIVPDVVIETFVEPAVGELERNCRDIENSTKQLCSDTVDLENYENELKLSSGDKDSLITDVAPENGVSGKSKKVVRVKVFDNAFSENIKSAQTDLISQSEPSENGPSKINCGNGTQQVKSTDENGATKEVTGNTACVDLVGQAASVVEYYVSMMEEDSHAMMSRLLEQGIEFWLSHSLPVDHLENLLLKHMSKFFYPLGLLLFCKDGNTGEEKVETQKQAVSMLNHLSTRFCLQLCSSLLNHINQRKAYPEYIEVLAQVTSMQAAPSLNGCCVTSQGLSQSPEQLMEAILEGLGTTKELGGSLGQTYINLQEEASETCKDPASETTKLEQLLAFSCGHHYGQSVFYQSILPELELGLLQLHHPLPNTARVLKGLFGSNSPNLHLACPRCVLSYLRSQTTPPL
ncbi:uncharacterized protein LOC110827029 isoform X3 [Zootermopsis nevadensis]|nr:uncharacterized protein LOC110827029 isoform X3 [Zootermopsis nevadensis]